MMTIDDEGQGEGGVWQMMTSSQKFKIFGKFLEFYREFYQNFPQNFQIQGKISPANLKLNLNQIFSGLLQGMDY